MNNENNTEQKHSFTGFIDETLKMVKNKTLEIASHNINNLFNQYDLDINYIKPLHNKIIAVVIANQKLIWEFNVQNNSLNLSFIKDENFDNKRINLKIMLPVSSLILNLAENNSGNFLSKVKIEGDAHLASNISKLIQSLNIELEDILSLKLPPKLSYLFSEFIKKQSSTIKNGINSISTHTSEYLMYEKNIVISKIEFEDLDNKLMRLRDDTDRVQQKFSKLLKISFNSNNFSINK